MIYTFFILFGLFAMILPSSSLTIEATKKSEKRELLEGNAVKDSKAVPLSITPGIVYALNAPEERSHSPSQLYATPSPHSKISDVVLRGGGAAFSGAVANQLVSSAPAQAYQANKVDSKKFTVSEPVSSKLAFVKHQVFMPVSAYDKQPQLADRFLLPNQFGHSQPSQQTNTLEYLPPQRTQGPVPNFLVPQFNYQRPPLFGVQQHQQVPLFAVPQQLGFSHYFQQPESFYPQSGQLNSLPYTSNSILKTQDQRFVSSPVQIDFRGSGDKSVFPKNEDLSQEGYANDQWGNGNLIQLPQSRSGGAVSYASFSQSHGPQQGVPVLPSKQYIPSAPRGFFFQRKPEISGGNHRPPQVQTFFSPPQQNAVSFSHGYPRTQFFGKLAYPGYGY